MKELTANTLRMPNLIMIECEDAVYKEIAASTVCMEDITIEIVQGKNLAVSISSPNKAVKRVRLRWNCPTERNVRIMGDHWERSYGDLEFRGIVAERALPWYYVASDGYNVTCSGVLTGTNSFCFWNVDVAGVTLTMDCRSGGVGVKLGDRKLLLAEVIFDSYAAVSEYEASRDFCKQLAHDSGIFPDVPVYGANNWYYAYGRSSHEEILADAAYLAKLTDGIENRPYMVIDDGWEKNRGCIGPWREGNQGFPDMKRLAEEITAMNVLPGIWFRPLFNPDIPAEWRLDRDTQFADPSMPEVLTYIEEDVKCFCDWGYKLIKYDFSTCDILGRWGGAMGSDITDDGWRFHDDTKTTAEIIKNLYATIYNASKGRAYILGCNCIGHLGVGYMHLNRTGDDTSGIVWERTRRMGMNNLAFRMCQHGSFFHIDADCAGITENIEWTLNRQWLKLLSESGTPLFVSNRPNTLTKEQEAELSKAYHAASVERECAIPLGLLNTTAPNRWIIGGEEVEFYFDDDFGAIGKM